jgi:hypothetical protein
MYFDMNQMMVIAAIVVLIFYIRKNNVDLMSFVPRSLGNLATQRNMVILAAVAAVGYYLWTQNQTPSFRVVSSPASEGFAMCGSHKSDGGESFFDASAPLVTGNYLSSEKHQQSFEQNTSVSLGALQASEVPVPNVDYGKVTNVDTKGGIPLSMSTKYLVDVQGKTDVPIDRKLIEGTPFGVSPHVLNAAA